MTSFNTLYSLVKLALLSFFPDNTKLSISNNIGNVVLLEDEYGISPGQACVFYKNDDYGDKLLGGGWISN